MSGYVLENKSGKVIEETFATDRDSCWSLSFRYLEKYKWMRPMAHKWEESIKAAKNNGWKIVPAKVVRV